MLRIDLNVPDDEYEKARKLGARWDAAAQIWYIDNSFDPTPFMNWLPFYNVHAEYWYLAQTWASCPHCHKHTTVTAFMLPVGHKMLEDNDDDYTEQDSPAFLFYIADIPTTVRNVLSSFHHTLRKTVGQRIRREHWINYCEHCDAQQDDANLFTEVGGAFFPASREKAAAIQLHRIDEPFMGYCQDISHQRLHIEMENTALRANKGAYTSGDWFELMTHVVNTPSGYHH
ncbi:DUF5710 domain-containing protein [Xenorhabdus bovienii]|uniref:DUF5710 domain-containing protein n=1 Tax=Xenorhabdus bovienii TaxID=40576 RepID=UPI00237CCBE3|nr:DUF5710 domain-containing protein [Xenorhabdus bovienii]MDE1486562.1 DUF5710 domain-containing protein [Xenorhabdus bovienii]MDE1496054.1 DUF5710 domain-containing protein [Xenorhabdus bovienii]MDE9446600.1 DUF5710 domain-containing protein [Xenorhabdus bovienii]MDE9474082.1 DUF5710 domain-containing protein [Xenorhabdus bovienii]MDE9477182.1 DUF5710 domain-containing protein [Xenorhabdus bovienii]